MSRRTLAAIVLLISCAALMAINQLVGDEPSSWAQVAEQGCSSKAFDLPTSVLPPELAGLLGNTASQRDKELRSEFLASIDEFAGQAFPGVPVNINCERASYDPAALNIYFVARDPDQQFVWAKGLILNRSDASRVIIFGQEFWEFFGEAWGPIWGWRHETSDPGYLSALADYTLDEYLFYLEWAVAHEMGHIRLGHHAAAEHWHTAAEQQREVAADMEAARILRRQYHLVSGYLLGLVKETLKSGYYETYHRRWQREDGDPLDAEWTIEVKQCDTAHPPFIVRSLSMLEAAAKVEEEQAKEIQRQEEEGIQQALSEGNDLESQIALKQQKENQNSTTEPGKDSPASVIPIARRLRGRILIKRPVAGICFDKMPSFLWRRAPFQISSLENSDPLLVDH